MPPGISVKLIIPRKLPQFDMLIKVVSKSRRRASPNIAWVTASDCMLWDCMLCGRAALHLNIDFPQGRGDIRQETRAANYDWWSEWISQTWIDLLIVLTISDIKIAWFLMIKKTKMFEGIKSWIKDFITKLLSRFWWFFLWDPIFMKMGPIWKQVQEDRRRFFQIGS